MTSHRRTSVSSLIAEVPPFVGRFAPFLGERRRALRGLPVGGRQLVVVRPIRHHLDDGDGDALFRILGAEIGLPRSSVSGRLHPYRGGLPPATRHYRAGSGPHDTLWDPLDRPFLSPRAVDRAPVRVSSWFSIASQSYPWVYSPGDVGGRAPPILLSGCAASASTMGATRKSTLVITSWRPACGWHVLAGVEGTKQVQPVGVF